MQGIRLTPAPTPLESASMVTPFQPLVLRRFRAAHSSGFLLGEHWSLLKTPVIIPAFWQSLMVRVGFFILTKVNAFVFLLMSACLRGVINRTLIYRASHPALRIDGQSLP